MENLNNYLTALASRKGSELLFEPNSRLRLVAFDGNQDLTPFELTGAQISMLIFPIIPANERQMLPNQPEVRFDFMAPSIGEFNFLVKKSPAGFIVSIRTKADAVANGNGATAPPKIEEPKPTSYNAAANIDVAPPQQQVSDFPFSVPSSVPKPAPSTPLSVNPFINSVVPSASHIFTPTIQPPTPPQNPSPDMTPQVKDDFFSRQSEPSEIHKFFNPPNEQMPEPQHETHRKPPVRPMPTETHSFTPTQQTFVPQPNHAQPAINNALPVNNEPANFVQQPTVETVNVPPKPSSYPTLSDIEAELNSMDSMPKEEPTKEMNPPTLTMSSTTPLFAQTVTPAYTEDNAAKAMENLFHATIEMKASDLHLCVGMPPLVRKDGKIMVLDTARTPWTKEESEKLLTSIMPEKNLEEFTRRHDTDFAYELPGMARFRANVFMDRKGCGGVFRLIPHKILTAEELGLSNAILNLCNLTKGLVVVTGPTGSGKSTTLCAMIDYINRSRDDHIITIEDPIEFVHENKKCLINQREVFTHTDSFRDALRAALREDPDILLVGEMRDLETISIAIETAETGHLVFGTLHTTTAASTVDRIIDQFPTDRQAQIRVMLSESLRGVIAQTLLKKRGGGRIAALEVLIITPAISNLIREGKTFQIASSMQTGKGIGMVSLNDSLMEHVQRGIVDPEEAYLKSVDKMGFEALLKRSNFPLNIKTQ